MKVLVTGSDGQLGSELKDLTKNYKKLDLFFKDLPNLDICNFNLLQSFINENEINAVINCAAYTDVDKAEDESIIAKKVNCEGVLNIVNALRTVNGKLIHISTDYVFDGNHYLPYKESDPVSPIGVYGETKRAGELQVFNSDLDSIVIRTSWLYSSHGKNFMKTMLDLGTVKKNLGVINDQVGTPTYARDLAKTCLDILSGDSSLNISKNGNLYNYSNEGVSSWYDFAISVMELAGKKCKVSPIQTSEYPTAAKRPHFSLLNKSKIKTDFKIEIPHWRDSLKDCINKIID